MLYSSIKKIALVTVLSITFSSISYAADISRTLRTNTGVNSEPENFFEIGIGAGAGIGSSFTDDDAKGTGMGVNVSGSYNWKGFFIDLWGESSDPLVLGYNAYNSDNWSFDAIFTKTGPGIRTKESDVRLNGINSRSNNSMLGGRLTGYFGENIVQFTLKHDVSDKSNGTVASALIGRNWQVRNWNFHSLAGLTLVDANYNNYFLGVSEQEATISNIAAYNGKSSVHFNSSLGVTYPISEDWVFRATVNAGSNFGYNDSPLFSKRRTFYAGLSLSISYVF